MKRYWPLYLALFCWLLVVIQPAARQGVFAAWHGWALFVNYGSEHTVAPPFSEVSPATVSLLKQYPADRQIEIYAANEFGFENSRNVDYLLKSYPNDAFVLSLYFRCIYKKLKPLRKSGALTRMYPPAPPAERATLRPQ